MKRNILTKTLAILVPVILLLSMIAAVNAADFPANLPDTSGGQPRSLTIHKYVMDNTTDATENGTGLASDIADVPVGAVLIDGVDFYVIKAFTAADLSGNTTGYTQVGSTGYWYLTALTGAKTATTGSGVTGQAIFTFAADGTEDGIYAVVERDPRGVVNAVGDDFLVTIPMDHPANNDAWLYNIHVYPKNPAIPTDITKKFANGNETKQSFAVGDEITFEIATVVPKSIASATEFRIVDPLGTKFGYVAATNSVTVNGSAFSGYRLSYTPGGDLVIDFDTDSGAGLDFSALNPDDEIVFIFRATLLASAITAPNVKTDGTSTYVDNGAVLWYNNNDTETTAALNPRPYFAAIQIKKIDALTPTKTLAGAVFELYADNAGALGTKLATSTATGSDGLFTFGGLEYDLDVNTVYWLKETVAATGGYNLLRNPVAVTISKDGGVVTVDIENRKGFTLPITGGAGVVMFSIIGAVLMGGSLLLLAGQKKRKVSK